MFEVQFFVFGLLSFALIAKISTPNVFSTQRTNKIEELDEQLNWTDRTTESIAWKTALENGKNWNIL